jgi:hypothetical protein
VLRSLETVTLDFTAGGTVATANLSKGQNPNHCVLIPSKEHDHGLAGGQIATDLQIAVAPLRVQGQRLTGGAGGLLVEVTVKEYNPAQVMVQKGAWFIAIAAASTTFAFAAVVLGRTYAIAHGRYLDPDSGLYTEFCELDLPATTQGRIRRYSTVASMIGHWEVAEALPGVWNVQQVSGTMGGGSNLLVLPLAPAVVRANTFGVWSYRTDEASTNAFNASCRGYLNATTQWWVLRNNTPGSQVNATAFVVEGVGINVQRGTSTLIWGGTLQTDTWIVAIDLTRSFVWGMSHQCWGGCDVGQPINYMGAPGAPASCFTRKWFLLANQFRAHRQDPTEDIWFSWEVVEMPLSGGGGPACGGPSPGPMAMFDCCVSLPADCDPIRA